MEDIVADMTRLKTKVGSHEFEAEGGEEFVSALFKQFLSSVEHQVALPVAASTPAEVVEPTFGQKREQAEPQLLVESAKAAGTVDAARLEKIFRLDQKKHEVSLRFLPKTGKSEVPDSILLLVMGFLILLNIEEVSVMKLKQCAVQSGLKVERLDRHTLAILNRNWMLKSGLGKGGKYRLTNSGLAVAEKLAEEMLAHVI